MATPPSDSPSGTSPGSRRNPRPETSMDPQASPPLPELADLQHWIWLFGRTQQMMMESGLRIWAEMGSSGTPPIMLPPPSQPLHPTGEIPLDPFAIMKSGADFWQQQMDQWQGWRVASGNGAKDQKPPPADRRFAAPEWQANPVFDLIRRSYLMACDQLLSGVDALPGLDAKQREQLRFATRNVTDALSPANFVTTNPVILQKTIETRGENLLKGLEHMLRDLEKGQLTHTDSTAFEVGRNIAITPGKVVYETALFQLIQYQPVTPRVNALPVVIFPPWINRFYILDLNPQKSFVRWAVEQGLSVFMVSWKSADASLAHIVWDDYVNAELEAIDTIRTLLDVPSVHAIGYCVAGTTLAAALSLLATRDQATKVDSATFFTAQVDFSQAGDLGLFVDDNHLALIQAVSKPGYLDGRYMAATFNLLRGRDLIWNYIVNNYLLGQDYPPFDLLHWNGDTTNLPAKWHRSYLTDLYRDNRLAQPGSLSIDGTPIDLTRVETPAYIQAGREDHIAPAESVWKITHHFQGPMRFVLAGSGHIAGVVNPPSANKYQYWTNETPVATFAEFVSGATEHKGSWWPDWRAWLLARAPETVPATGARIPGEGALDAIEDAPGRYVKMR